MPRNSTFVDYVCQHISRFDLRHTNLQVVLPTIRLGRVIGKRLSDLAKQENKLPCWMPQFVTIDKLIGSFSHLGKADSLELLSLLYLSYAEVCEQEKAEARSLDRFWEWGRMLISDFNQIDNQLAPAQDILQYMAEEKRIGSWHLDLGSSQGKLQSNYLAFYALLAPLYQNFRQKLLQENIAYTGLAGRTACEKLPQLLQENALPKDTFYLFAGFNALTAAEKKIIKTLVREKKAEILWNADQYYLNDEMQEAGHFLRQYRQDEDLNHFLKDEDICDHIRHAQIEVVECAQRSAQAKWVAQYLNTQKEFENTAVVLNDEGLFAPLMNALPEHVSCNATLAAPLSGTAAGALFAQLVELRHFLLQNHGRHLTAQQFLKLLRNPLLALFADKKRLTQKENDVLDSHRSYYSLDELSDCLNEENLVNEMRGFVLSEKGEKPAQIITRLQKIARTLLDFMPPAGTQTSFLDTALNDFEKAYLLYVEENCQAYVPVLEKYEQLIIGEPSLQHLFDELLSGADLSYIGDREKSLNIMGMLETRGLNFKHAIVLSMNEGILPSTSKPESFLLNSVRVHYGLPMQMEEAAMQAHHFYGLLQDCERATLLYVNSAADRNAEKSRFILQLEHELPAQLKHLPSPDFALINPGFDAESLIVEKTPPVIEAIKRRLSGSGLSYSSLHTYFACPLRFYLQYVLNLGEPPQVQDEIDHGIKGSVFHKAMECFFTGDYPGGKTLLNKTLSEKDVKNLREAASTLVALALQEEFKDGNIEHGANYLAIDETKILMERYADSLEKETKEFQVRVLSCEHPFNARFEDLVEGIEVRLNGFADRLDLVKNDFGECLRIIDYKTGSTDNKGLDPETWDQLRETEYKKALQLSFYVFLYRHEFPQEKRDLQACICGVKRHGIMLGLGESLRQSCKDEKDYLNRLKKFLRDSIKEMLNPDIPIRRTINSECTYCSFAQLCQSHDQDD